MSAAHQHSRAKIIRAVPLQLDMARVAWVGQPFLPGQELAVPPRCLQEISAHTVPNLLCSGTGIPFARVQFHGSQQRLIDCRQHFLTGWMLSPHLPKGMVVCTIPALKKPHASHFQGISVHIQCISNTVADWDQPVDYWDQPQNTSNLEEGRLWEAYGPSHELCCHATAFLIMALQQVYSPVNFRTVEEGIAILAWEAFDVRSPTHLTLLRAPCVG